MNLLELLFGKKKKSAPAPSGVFGVEVVKKKADAMMDYRSLEMYHPGCGGSVKGTPGGKIGTILLECQTCKQKCGTIKGEGGIMALCQTAIDGQRREFKLEANDHWNGQGVTKAFVVRRG